MVSINWCSNQSKGIKVVEPNDNLAESYLKMAQNALGTMNRERKYNSIFAVSACYYSMYYSLYSVLRKIGIKCEIHSCSIKFMEVLLLDYYTKDDLELIKKAFDARDTMQYYADKVVDQKDIDEIINNASYFVSKSKGAVQKVIKMYTRARRDYELNFVFLVRLDFVRALVYKNRTFWTAPIKRNINKT
jgi:uncharacterized protein (UPF0332 family)